MNSTLSFLLSFYYRSTTVNGNARCSLACLPRLSCSNQTRYGVTVFFIPPYRFTSQACYRQHCVYSFHKSYARGYYTTPHGFRRISARIPYTLPFKGTRIVMFQISGFYYTVVQYKYIGTRREWYYCSLRTLWVPPVVSE